MTNIHELDKPCKEMGKRKKVVQGTIRSSKCYTVNCLNIDQLQSSQTEYPL